MARNVARIRQATTLPIAVGFGVKSADQARALAGPLRTPLWSAPRWSLRIGDSLDPEGRATGLTVPALLELVSTLARGLALPQDRQAREPSEEGSRDELDQEFRPAENPLLPRRQARVPENMWVKCPETGQMVFYRDLEANQFVIPGFGLSYADAARCPARRPCSTAANMKRSTCPRSPSIRSASATSDAMPTA